VVEELGEVELVGERAFARGEELHVLVVEDVPSDDGEIDVLVVNAVRFGMGGFFLDGEDAIGAFADEGRVERKRFGFDLNDAILSRFLVRDRLDSDGQRSCQAMGGEELPQAGNGGVDEVVAERHRDTAIGRFFCQKGVRHPDGFAEPARLRLERIAHAERRTRPKEFEFCLLAPSFEVLDKRGILTQRIEEAMEDLGVAVCGENDE